jgi:hypothetical protein
MAMLHMMKLAVGVRDPAHLRALQAERMGGDLPLQHRTRHMPRRAAEIIGGGSLFWVIGGAMLVRQRVIGIEPAVRDDGTACAAILFDPALVAVTGRPVKAFQGWRYLRAEDAPDDLDPSSAEAGLPPALAQRLRELCLL